MWVNIEINTSCLYYSSQYLTNEVPLDKGLYLRSPPPAPPQTDTTKRHIFGHKLKFSDAPKKTSNSSCQVYIPRCSKFYFISSKLNVWGGLSTPWKPFRLFYLIHFLNIKKKSKRLLGICFHTCLKRATLIHALS